MRFSLRKDLINHRDINVIDFYNGQDVNFIINVYSDSNQTALQVLCNNTKNIGNTLVMIGDYHKWSLTEFVIEEFWILKQGRISNKRCC